MGVRRKRKSGFVSKLRRLGFLALLGAGAFVAWQQLQRRRSSAPTAVQSTSSSKPVTRSSPAATPPQKAPAQAPLTEEPSLAQPVVSAPASDNGDDSTAGKIKGNAGSMLYHTVDSPNYKRTKAERFFDTEEEARAAGFQRWDHKRGSRS